MNKQLVIPMSGLGTRFINAGYKNPKPLIRVSKKQILKHIVEMYPGWDNILFIVNSDHFKDPDLNLEHELASIAPRAQISVISKHKNGPSYAVLESMKFLINDGPIVINYCDFAGEFDLAEFERKIFEFDCNLLTYTGFHPHMLRNTKYAYLLKKDDKYLDIQEKNSFTNEPMDEEASAGAYSFKNKDLLEKAIRHQIKNNLNYGGELYTSLTVKSVLQLGGKISTTKMTRFFQWGTPEDLEEFNYWNEAIDQIYTKRYSHIKSEPNNVIALMGGTGSRLKNLTEQPKPLISILDRSLWEQSLKSINEQSQCILVVRKELLNEKHKVFFEDIVILEDNTKGQAHSAYLGLAKVDNLFPITILATDCILPVNYTTFALQFMNEKNLDLVVWAASKYPPALRESDNYSYVTGSENVVAVKLKKRFTENEVDQELITGNFTFRNKNICQKILDELLNNNNELVNDEFYLDSSINIAMKLGFRVGKISVPYFLSIGTADELLTFKYWCR